MRAADPDVVFSLAAGRAKATPAERAATIAVNTSPWLVDALPDRCRTVVRLGSSTEYAASPRPLAEDAALEPRGFFGATKAAGSLLLQATAAERGVRAAVLRAFQVYGPGDHPTRLVPVVLEAARSGTAVPLPVRLSRRDWVWVGDVVDACVRAAVDDALPPGRGAQHRHRRADEHRGAGRDRGPRDRAGRSPPSPARIPAATGTPPTGCATRPPPGRCSAGRPPSTWPRGWPAPGPRRDSPSSSPCTATRRTLEAARRAAGRRAGRPGLAAAVRHRRLAGRQRRRRAPARRGGRPDRGDRPDRERRVSTARSRRGWPPSRRPTRGSASTPTCRTRPRRCRCCSTGWTAATSTRCSPGAAAPTSRSGGGSPGRCTAGSPRG